MKRPHLFQVAAPASAFEGLIADVRGAGVRVGWLDLETAVELPPELAGAAAAGALRAVAVSPHGSVTVKPRAGAWVLADLLREHFLGCRLVLVRGALPAAQQLAAVGDDRWRLSAADGASRELSTAELVARLRRPPRVETPGEPSTTSG